MKLLLCLFVTLVFAQLSWAQCASRQIYDPQSGVCHNTGSSSYTAPNQMGGQNIQSIKKQTVRTYADGTSRILSEKERLEAALEILQAKNERDMTAGDRCQYQLWTLYLTNRDWAWLRNITFNDINAPDAWGYEENVSFQRRLDLMATQCRKQ